MPENDIDMLLVKDVEAEEVQVTVGVLAPEALLDAVAVAVAVWVEEGEDETV